jgi:hypothetical protein
MLCAKACLLVLLPICSAFGGTIIGLGDAASGSSRNQEYLAGRASAIDRPTSADTRNGVVVFIGDRVIPHFIDGADWQTAITVINLENYPTAFDVLFMQDNGSDLYAPIKGVGTFRGLHVTLGTAESLTFETAGTAPQLSSGWALLSQSNTDSVGMFAIFRQSPDGVQPQEAVVPAVNQFNSHFVLPFDNSGSFVTGVALANPTLNRVSIPVNIRDESGHIIDSQYFALGPYSHTAFVLPSTWTSTAGKRGTAEFLTSGFGVGALGLRFYGFAFTSLNVLQNFDWAVQ